MFTTFEQFHLCDGRLFAHFYRHIKNFDIEEWNKKKYNVMLNGLKDKFINNPDLKHKLINTNNSILYEAAPRDKIWGIGYLSLIHI